MFTLLFIGMLMSVTIAWFLIQRLQDKPWTQHGVLPASQDDLTSSAPKVGLWAFLGVVSSVFLIFTAAYFMRMNSSHGGMPSSGMEMQSWVPVAEPGILWFNTTILIAASVALEMARSAANRSAVTELRRLFAAVGIMTVIFLAGQTLAWQIVANSSHMTLTTPAFAFFVLLTTVHGLHLIGGLFVLTRAIARIWGGIDSGNIVALNSIRQTVQLCATYWHFLLLVWLGLFLMLLST